MGVSLTSSDEQKLQQLRLKACGLEEELERINTAIQTISSRIQALKNPSEGMKVTFNHHDVEHTLPRPSERIASSSSSELSSPLPEIVLQPLAPHDPLRGKWHIDDLPSPEGGGAPLQEPNMRSVSGRVRLFGIMANGEPCELIIPFSQIATGDGVVIGRDSQTAQYALNDPSVSRSHAVLSINNGGLAIRDLNSTNGLFIDGERVHPYQGETPLRDGMILSFGEVSLRVELNP